MKSSEGIERNLNKEKFGSKTCYEKYSVYVSDREDYIRLIYSYNFFSFRFVCFFFITILKINENVIPCDKDVKKVYLKDTLSIRLFQHKIKLVLLSNELVR